MTAHIIDGLLDCIMLVDDNESTNFYNSIVIQKAGLHVHVQEVINGMDALNYLMGKGSFSGHTSPLPQPGIIFLDINMPGMDGWEFLQEYQNLPADRRQRIAVHILTTSSNPDDIKKADENEYVEGFISKPLNPRHVLDIVNIHWPHMSRRQ